MKFSTVLFLSSALFATSFASSDFAEVCNELANMNNIMAETVTSVAKSCIRPRNVCLGFRWSAWGDYNEQITAIRGQLGCDGLPASVSEVSSVCDSLDELPSAVGSSLMEYFESPKYSKIYQPLLEKVQAKAAELSSSLANKIC